MVLSRRDSFCLLTISWPKVRGHTYFASCFRKGACAKNLHLRLGKRDRPTKQWHNLTFSPLPPPALLFLSSFIGCNQISPLQQRSWKLNLLGPEIPNSCTWSSSAATRAILQLQWSLQSTTMSQLRGTCTISTAWSSWLWSWVARPSCSIPVKLLLLTALRMVLVDPFTH